MHRGYIKLWRKIEDHPFHSEPREYSKYEAWLDLLMNAQHSREPRRVVVGMNVLLCHYGETLKSINTWADRWKWSRSKVFRYLKLLKKMEQITYNSETVTTRINIINYEAYDQTRNAGDTQAERERNDRETQAVTDKNVKNAKNGKDSTLTGTCPPDEPPDDTPPKNNTPPCPHIKIVNLYHEICPELPHIKVWDDTAKGWLRSRWSESKERQSLEWWSSFFSDLVKTSDLLMGRAKPWKADLRWIVKAGNFAKIMNGNYINRGSGNSRLDKNIRAGQQFLEMQRRAAGGT